MDGTSTAKKEVIHRLRHSRAQYWCNYFAYDLHFLYNYALLLTKENYVSLTLVPQLKEDF